MSISPDVIAKAASGSDPAAVSEAAHQGIGDLKSLRRCLSELQSQLSATQGQQGGDNGPPGAVEKLVQERLQGFATTMTGWFWETDAALRFTYFSPSVEGITGVPAEWRYGITREDFGLPESVRPRIGKPISIACAGASHSRILSFSGAAPMASDGCAPAANPYSMTLGTFKAVVARLRSSRRK